MPSSADLSLMNRLRAWIGRHRTETDYGQEPERKGWIITFCFLISLFLWFALTVQEIYTVQFELPTEVVNLPDDMALTQLPPKSVQVQVRGEGLELLELRFNPVVIPVDASQDEIILGDVTTTFSQNVTLENVSPRLFNLVKERRVERRVPIRLSSSISTPAEYDLIAPPHIQPDSVTLSGARSIIQNIEFWPTARFMHTNLKDSLVTSIALSDSLDGLVSKSIAFTTLTASSEKFTEETRAINVTMTKMPTTQRFVTLDPSTVRVTYRVPLSEYERALTAQDFFATVDYDTIREDTTGRVRPKLNLPVDLNLRNVRMVPEMLGYYEVLLDE